MSSNSVYRRAADESILFTKRPKLDENAAMSVSEQPGDRRPNFSAVNGGVKASATIAAAKPGDIKKIIIKNFKSKSKVPRGAWCV